MKLSQQNHGAVTLLKPEGPLVEAELAEFRKTLNTLLASMLGRVVEDMSAVPFVDSVGLEALLDVSDALTRVGRCLKLCSVNKVLRQVMDLTQIGGQFDLYED